MGPEDGVLTFEQIKELIELVARHGLQAVEVERSGFRVRIDGKAARPLVAAAAAAASAEGTGAPPPGEAPEEAAPVAESAAPAPAESEAHVLRSPIVGTFYRSPSPGSEPYVEIGDRVKTGQVLCIVEAMKLMNEIESDADGVVERIFPQNAEPVEFGEPLFAIRQD